MLIIIPIFIAVISFPEAFSEVDNVPEYVPCERGWYYFGEKCYKIGARKRNDRLPWKRALEKCKSYGGDLVSIGSKEEQDFVRFLQTVLKSWVWIGLNDIDKEGDWKWTDGTVFNYTNWKAGGGWPYKIPSNEENCVHMFFEPHSGQLGKWNDRGCGVAETYVCEMKPNPRKKSPNPMYCSTEAGKGWKWDDSCYYIVTEKKSWQNAENYCKSYYNGHLLSILDRLEDYFVEYMLRNTKEEFWIGMKIQEQLQQKWTSGWFVSYDGFKNGVYLEGCAAWRKSWYGEWISLPCKKELPFVCKVSEETPPAFKPAPRGAHCPLDGFDGWRDLEGEYCYYFETEKTLNFYEALFDCTKKGGTLASMHSKEEADILLSFVKFSPLGMFYPFWVGLHRSYPREDEFAWTDGSEVNYANWGANQPDNEKEECVEIETYGLGTIYKWNDVSCTEKRGYICSIKKVVSNSPLAEEDECKKFCISPNSYLYEVVQQSSDAKEVP